MKFNLNGTANQTTGVTGTVAGITTVVDSGNGADTIQGATQTYTITGADDGNNGTISWTNFENLADTATGTLRATNATWTLNASNTGTVSNLGGTFAGMGNLTDLGSGSFNMHGTADGSITGNLIGGTAGTLSYANYTAGVSFGLGGGAGTSTGIAGTRAGITNVVGSGNADTINGTTQTYTVTASNAGNNGAISWTAFENLADSATGTLRATSATWTLNASNTGTVRTSAARSRGWAT